MSVNEIQKEEDFELVDEEDPEIFEFDKTFVKTLHKLGVSAQKFLDTWRETIDESIVELTTVKK